jgi:hypothetical protein
LETHAFPDACVNEISICSGHFALSPTAIAVAAVVFDATAAAVVAIVAAAVAVTIATTTTLLSLRWHLCCADLLSCCHASWLLPVALPLLLASLTHIPLLADCCV